MNARKLLKARFMLVIVFLKCFSETVDFSSFFDFFFHLNFNLVASNATLLSFVKCVALFIPMCCGKRVFKT